MNRILFYCLTCMVVVLAGCTSAPMPEVPEQDVAKILSMDTPEGEYGEKVRCISTHSYTNVDVLDRNYLLFEGRGDNVWLNHLRTRCVGLRRNDVLRFDITSGRLCSLDSVSGLDRGLFGFSRASAKCALGDFEKITKDQAALLRELIRESRGKAVTR